MMTEPPQLEIKELESSPPRSILTRPSYLSVYAYFIGKNILGWVLILSSWALGLVSPIPIGFLFFLIGFGLVWFPGKRKLTARVLSGRPIPTNSTPYRVSLAVLAIILPTLLIIYLVNTFRLPYRLTAYTELLLALIYIAAAGLTLFFGLPLILISNRLLALVPKFRRRARPWMRRRGVDLLPPRRRKRRIEAGGPITRAPDPEIIQIDPATQERVRNIWLATQTWTRRIGGIGITAAILVWILKPVWTNWDLVKDRLVHTDWRRMLFASAVFGTFLFVFRAMSWRRILIGFGHHLPVATAARIWSTSELARYLPGVIWQVVGRAYLVRPYGVSGGICSASQILELTIFLLANILLAIGCLTWFGYKQLHETARWWLILVSLMAPLLLIVLHPRIFYGTTDRILTRLGRKPVSQRLRFRELLGLLAYAMIGLLWQSVAIYLATAQYLNLQLTKWWVVAGAYCLAWCAGFLAFWAPGGLGVRELVFVAAMQVALPEPVRKHFSNPQVLLSFLAFLSVLLRLWATTGELMLASASSIADFRGLLGHINAPGRSATKANNQPLATTAAACSTGNAGRL